MIGKMLRADIFNYFVVFAPLLVALHRHSAAWVVGAKILSVERKDCDAYVWGCVTDLIRACGWCTACGCSLISAAASAISRLLVLL